MNTEQQKQLRAMQEAAKTQPVKKVTDSAEYKKLWNNYEVLQGEYGSLQQRCSSLSTALEKWKYMYQEASSSKDTLSQLVRALEVDEKTGVYYLGEEAQDAIDAGRKLCGIK